MLMVLSNEFAGYYPEGASESCFENENEPSPTFPANEPLWMNNEVSKPLLELLCSRHPILPSRHSFYYPLFSSNIYSGRSSGVEMAKRAPQ